MADELKYLQKPLSLEEMKSNSEDNYIEGIIAISDTDLIENDFEGFLDIISENLCGSICLMDINYKMVGCLPEERLILYRVRGDVSEVIEMMEDRDETEED